LARILEGSEPIRSKPLDEKFIRVIESALELPILQTRAGIESRYGTDSAFARDLDRWMRDGQGWTISDAELRDNLERAAKFSCYLKTLNRAEDDLYCERNSANSRYRSLLNADSS
jgi:hypothetical protein